MKNLRTLFAEAKNSNENATLEIIDFFKPIIDKHVRQSKYSEDVRSELTLHLIEIIKTLDLDKLRCSTDFALINYIKKSLYHCYLNISMTEQQRRQKENHYEDDDLIDLLGADTDAENAENDILLDLLMKSVLTEKEYICIKLMVIRELSASQAGKILGITKQTANTTKLRGIKKLRKVYEERNK